MKVCLKIKCLVACLFSMPLFGQDTDSLFSLLESEMGLATEYTTATFKTTRLVNCHTVERLGKGDLDFRINHRFGRVNQGVYDFFGLDQASNYLNLEYGATNKMTLGIGRANWKKTYSGLFKYLLFRQSKGDRIFPLSIALVSSVFVQTLKWEHPGRTNYFWSRVDYSHQLLVARKLSSWFSLQIAPTLVHRNFTESPDVANDIFSVAFSARYKITRRIAITSEYFAVATKNYSPFRNPTPPLSLGMDIETGGHVFQLHFSNASCMTENGFIPFTTGKWSKGDIQFGFNISRVFKW